MLTQAESHSWTWATSRSRGKPGFDPNTLQAIPKQLPKYAQYAQMTKTLPLLNRDSHGLWQTNKYTCTSFPNIVRKHSIPCRHLWISTYTKKGANPTKLWACLCNLPNHPQTPRRFGGGVFVLRFLGNASFIVWVSSKGEFGFRWFTRQRSY